MRSPAAGNPARSLLLWGGEHESDGPYLEPAFVVDAAAVLPDSAAGYVLESLDAGERVLFSLSFPMLAIADAEEAAGGFAYTLPVRPGWEALASVTLTAPDGRTASLDGSTDRPMSILRTVARAGSGRFSAVPGRRSRRTAVAVGSRPPWARWRLRAGGCPLRDAWRR